MNKLLRYSFVALLAMVFGNVFAEDIIWSEDWSGWTEHIKAGDSNGINPNYTFEGTVQKDDHTYKSGTAVYNENTAGGTAPELLIAKTNGKWTVVVNLNGKSGDMTLEWNSNNTNIKVSSEDATIGTITSPSAKFYTCTVTAPAKASMTLVFYNTTGSNGRIDNIKLYQGSSSTQPAGIDWNPKTCTVHIGADDNVFPLLTNPNNLPITYSSSKPEVAEIDATTGQITLKTVGSTTITASFAGNESYLASAVNYSLTVKEIIDRNAKGQQNNPYLLTDEDFLTLATSLKPEDASSTSSSNPKSDKLYVKGYIVNIEDITDENLQQYGNMTFKIAAVKGDTNAEIKLKAYRCKYLENTKFTSKDQIQIGDEVVITGQIQWYGGSPQLISGCNLYSLNGETSGVNAIKANAQFQGKMYNVAGQVVNKGYKGLVIQDGRKFMNK